MATNIPEPPARNEDPWFDKRDAFDQAVRTRLNTELSDAALRDTIGEGVEAAAEDPDGVIVARGTATKTDGQNVRHFRRPTFAVDRWFPTGRNDHEIVYVDETAKVCYSVGRDRRFRKGTWITVADIGMAWEPALSGAPANHTWGASFCIKESVTGHLLMDEVDRSAPNAARRIIRSTDDGATWTTVLELPANKSMLGPQSICQDPVTKYLYVPEYTTVSAETTVAIWRSTDNGATWSVWKSMPRHDSNPGTIRHWHSARWDPVSQRVFFTAGDHNALGGIYRVNAGGTDIEPVIINSQLTGQFDVPYPARAVDVMFFPTHIAWGNDGGGGQNYVYRMARSQIGQSNPAVERIAAIDNTGWYVQRASTDGSIWVLSTSAEVGGGGTPDSAVVHLYTVSENGSAVDDVASVAMDNSEFGIASITGLGGGGGAGPAFWMRAHGYSSNATTRMNTSAFQMRARLGYGVVPLIKPPFRDKYVYRTEGRNWYGTATGSTRQVFGHVVVPDRTTRLVLFNWGVRELVASSLEMEIFSVTNNALLVPALKDSVDARKSLDADEYLSRIGCAAGDTLLFRMHDRSVGQAGASGSAFIEFGWAFVY